MSLQGIDGINELIPGSYVILIFSVISHIQVEAVCFVLWSSH